MNKTKMADFEYFREWTLEEQMNECIELILIAAEKIALNRDDKKLQMYHLEKSYHYSLVLSELRAD